MIDKAFSCLRKAALSAPAFLYYAVQKIRERAYLLGLLQSRQAGVPIISVGNILMGGSGKTPFVIYLADMFAKRGLKPAVVTRGYKGSYREAFLVVSDAESNEPLADPSVCGDEPYLMAKRLPHIPVIVGRRRIDPVEAAKSRFKSDLVLLDDGFQHLQLHRDLDVVLIDGNEDAMFPLGRLREPLSALKRAQVIVLTGSLKEMSGRLSPFVTQARFFQCEVVPECVINSSREADRIPVNDIRSRPVILVSGIANPNRFRATAQKLGWRVDDHVRFPDHHRFSEQDLNHLLKQTESRWVILTEKDWIKLPKWFQDHERTGALRIGMVPKPEVGFWNTMSVMIDGKLGVRQRQEIP